MQRDFGQLHKEAQRHLAQGRADRAEEIYRQLLANANVIEFEYNAWLEGAARTYRTLGRDREAGLVYLCLGRLDRARDLLPPEQHPVDAARVREISGRALLSKSGDAAAPLLCEAAALYAGAGRAVSAAIAYADAGALLQARQQWQRVLGSGRLRPQGYEEALCHFNLGLLARRAGDREEGRRHVIRAQQILEELADDFEARGERERAFDCYAVLLKLGQEIGSYENLAEGYINCIRVLKEDNLKFYVLQYYEDFLRESLQRKEHHAAAAVLREAADYTRRVGLIWDRDYLRRAGETWWQAAAANEAAGGPVKLTENALLSAIDSFCALSDFARVRETYRRLQELGLPDKRRRRYARLLQRLLDASFEPPQEGPPFPEYLRHQHAYPDIWHIDLLEWEHDGDPEQVAAAIVGDVKYADMVRRRALGVLLLCLSERGAPGPDQRGQRGQRGREQIAQRLGEMQTYASLRPLERMADEGDAGVRRAVMGALRHLCYKRTFQILGRGLSDEDEGVRGEALESLRALHFPHAVDPLIRLFREHPSEAVKRAALESLGRVGDLCAGEFLIEVLRHEGPAGGPLAEVARQALTDYGNPDILPILRRHMELATGRTREIFERIIRGS